MDTANWLKLKQLFHEALDLPSQEREAFLQQRCAAEPELRTRVLGLLAAQSEISETNAAAGGEPRGLPRDGGPLAEPRGQRTESSGAEPPGDQIGAYKLLQQIGEGGFGTVYLAEQQSPIRRRVALKIVKLGMDTRAFVSRFEHERQALALMDHPHIARVLDGGATESGRPYFVMELVRGIPVTEYCDVQKLAVPQRLELFAMICEAVQHAHQKGIIHRDLKPSNVLVSTQDGRPLVKVIDFGVAKALRDRLIDETVFTDFHQIIGTPRYMSPEQVEGSLDIDTRSDVYSLGVLLYQLLTGATPFDPTAARSIAELQRLIREVEPLRPSTRLSRTSGVRRDRDSSGRAVLLDASKDADNGSSLIDIARQRRTEPASLMRQLRGDLDWIVMKAIERDRTRRYESPTALAADIRRYLAQEPVWATPPTAAYRARKWIARHRAAFVSSLLVFVSLLLGIVGTTSGMLRAKIAQARAVEDGEKARRSEAIAQEQARRAEQIGDFLQNMLLAIDPDQARGRDVSVLREVLDETARRVDAELVEQPDVRSLMHSIIGRVYERLGLIQQAEHHAALAVELAASVFGGQSREYAISLQNLATARLQRSDVASARELYAQALSIHRRLHSGDHADVADAMCRVGEIEVLTGQYAAAESTLREAAAAHRRLGGSGTEALASALYSLVFLYVETGRASEAEAAAREGLPIVAHVCGLESTKYIEFMYTLGGIINEQGRYLEAAAFLESAATLANRVLPPDRELRATITNARALNLQMLGKTDEAEAEFRGAIALSRRLLPANALGLAPSLFNLAVLLMSKNELEEAEQLLREALRCYESNLASAPGGALAAMSRLSVVLEMRYDMAGAEYYAREALRLARGVEPRIASQIDDAAYRLGALLVELSWDDHAGPQRELARMRALEAIELLEEVISKRRRSQTATPISIARAECTLAGAYIVDCVTSKLDDPSLTLECLAREEQRLMDAMGRLGEATSGLNIARSGSALQIPPMWLARLYEEWHSLDPAAGKYADSARWYDRAADLRRAAGMPPLPICAPVAD